MTSSGYRHSWPTRGVVAAGVLMPLLALGACESEGIPVSGEVLDVDAAGSNEVSVTVQVANDGRETTDVRCEFTLVDANGRKTALTLVEPAVDPGESRTVTTKGPGAPEVGYSLDDATVRCRSE